MKRLGHLFERVCAWSNLWQAAIAARRGKRRRTNVAEFEFDRERQLLTLRDRLLNGTYRPGPYRSFRIYEPKARLISAAAYPDRVVHHAICQVIEPIWERVFIEHSYACRRGKGSLAAMQRAYRLGKSHQFVLKCDIQQFFPSVDHQVLMTQLRRKLKDQQLLRLLEIIIATRFPGQKTARFFPGDDLFTQLERPCGLPLGNQTSQFFGNVMLNPLDHFVTQHLRCSSYVRYADDFLVFAHNKTELHRIRAAIAEFLLDFRLRIHPHKSVVFPVCSGLPFLGYRLFPTHIELAKRHLQRLRQRLRLFERDYHAGQRTDTEILLSLQSWWGYAMHAHCRTMVHQIFADFPFIAEIRKAAQPEAHEAR